MHCLHAFHRYPIQRLDQLNAADPASTFEGCGEQHRGPGVAICQRTEIEIRGPFGIGPPSPGAAHKHIAEELLGVRRSESRGPFQHSYAALNIGFESLAKDLHEPKVIDGFGVLLRGRFAVPENSSLEIALDLIA